MQETDKLQMQALIQFPVGEAKTSQKSYSSRLLGLQYTWNYAMKHIKYTKCKCQYVTKKVSSSVDGVPLWWRYI